MISRALLQVDPKTGQYVDSNVASAAKGFYDRGIWCETFTYSDLDAGRVHLHDETVVVGGITAVRRALRELGHAYPNTSDYPEALKPYLRRKVWRATLGAVRAAVGEDHLPNPLFIKPVFDTKAFTGYTVFAFRDLITSASCPATMPVWVSEVVEFKSEFRVLVHKGVIVGCRHYNRDPLLFPNPQTVRNMVTDLEISGDAPVAYALDVGVLDTGETAVVELNDGFAFGTYGLFPDVHVKMLADRWCEMTGQPLTNW